MPKSGMGILYAHAGCAKEDAAMPGVPTDRGSEWLFSYLSDPDLSMLKTDVLRQARRIRYSDDIQISYVCICASVA